MSRGKLFISDFKPLLLSHHPNCDKFSQHVYHVGKYKLCIGCFTYYPTILITIIITVLLVDLNVIYNSLILFYLSFLLFSPILLSIFKLTDRKIVKILTKVSIGIGTGFYIVSAIYLPFPIIIKFMMLSEVSIFTGVIAYIRSKDIEKNCLKCDYNKNWDACPSMKPIMDKLYAHGFKKRKNQKESVSNKIIP